MKTAKEKLEAKGYSDSCTPNHLSEIVALMNSHAQPYKKALKIIIDSFPEDALQDQLGEDYHKIEKTLKSL